MVKKISLPDGWTSYAVGKPKGVGTMAKFMRHPCLVFLPKKIQEAVKKMDPEKVQEEGHYYIEDRNKSTSISFMVRTCPDGFHKDVRKQICIPLEGQDLKTLCKHTNRLTGKSPIDMLKEHYKNVSKTTKADNI